MAFTFLHAVSLSGWQRIPISYARQRLYLFPRRFTQWAAADCSFFRWSIALTVYSPFCSVDDIALLILLPVNGFHHLHAVLLSGWQRIPICYAGQRLYLFARHFALWMAADCSFLRMSTAFMFCVLFCSADGSRLMILPLVNGFHNGLRVVLPSR